MRSLTPRQQAALDAAHARWLEWIFSIEPADRDRAEEGVRLTYRAGGLPEPKVFLWFDDLKEALLVLEQLGDYRHSNWKLPDEPLRLREDVQQRLQTRLGLDNWEDVVQALGPFDSANRHETKEHKGVNFRVAVRRRDSLRAALPTFVDDPTSDCQAIDDIALSFGKVAFRAFIEIEQIARYSTGPSVPGHFGTGLVLSIYDDYRPALLFRHDCLLSILGEQTSARYNGLCLTLRHCGPWWAFANAAILCDRPRIACRDEERRLHNPSGPAVVFRNGVELFAWHGSGVPEIAIRNPESLTRTMISAENSGARTALIEIYGAERYERERKALPPRKPRNPLLIALPESLEEKIGLLRSYGPLPYYERYLAGEHRQVWQELGELGAAVREDRYAPDAVAVAHTTMNRVRQNIVTIVERLRELGYAFEAETGAPDKVIPFGEARANLWLNLPKDRPAPFNPPDYGWANLGRFQRDAGTLPISLRAWYEVVGSVNLLGKHPVLSPGDGSALSDPLVVLPFKKILRDWDHSPAEVGVDGTTPFVAAVARGSHITLPGVGMDAPLEGERHGLPFVEYLRLAFQWGCFPGFQNAGQRPTEINFLCDGLLAF